MMSRLIGAGLWLAVGHAVAFALYVALINVPDANIPMLLLTALLIITSVLTVALTEATVIGWLQSRDSLLQATTRGWKRAVPALLTGLALVAGIWTLASSADVWHEDHTGEIDAWAIATFDLAATGWLHRVIDAVLFVFCWIVGLSLGLSALCAFVLRGLPGGLLSGTWFRQAFSRMQLASVGMVVLTCFVLPWRAMDWRPARLPSTWVELAFVGAKLAALYLVAHAGWTVLLLVAGRPVTSTRARTLP